MTHGIYSGKSILRYPGGKARATGFLLSFFPKGLKTLVSPFIGGGSVELALAAKGIKVYGYDIFNPLVEFWQCTLEKPGALADEVEEYIPLAKDAFYTLQQTHTTLKTKLHVRRHIMAQPFLLSVLLSGGMSPGIRDLLKQQ